MKINTNILNEALELNVVLNKKNKKEVTDEPTYHQNYLRNNPEKLKKYRQTNRLKRKQDLIKLLEIEKEILDANEHQYFTFSVGVHTRCYCGNHSSNAKTHSTTRHHLNFVKNLPKDIKKLLNIS